LVGAGAVEQRCSSTEQGGDGDGETEHYVTMMRACILVALLYDTRVQRFIMTPHNIHYNVMQCQPPNRTKANMFMERVRGYIDDFLRRVIGIREMCFYCVEVWAEDFMLRRIEDVAVYSYSGRVGKPQHIPHNGRPQILSKVQHTNYDPSLQYEFNNGNNYGNEGGYEEEGDSDDLGF
jgi:hypothetical protein